MKIIQIIGVNPIYNNVIAGFGLEGDHGGYFEFEFAIIKGTFGRDYYVDFVRNERSGTRYGYSVPKHEAKIVGEL